MYNYNDRPTNKSNPWGYIAAIAITGIISWTAIKFQENSLADEKDARMYQSDKSKCGDKSDDEE